MTEVRKAVSKDLWSMTTRADYIVPEEWAANASRKLAVIFLDFTLLIHGSNPFMCSFANSVYIFQTVPLFILRPCRRLPCPHDSEPYDPPGIFLH